MHPTINEDGTPALIEAVYFRHHVVYAKVCYSIEGAIRYLNDRQDHDELSGVGVFVDGEPKITDHYGSPGRPPTDKEAVQMRKAYAEAERVDD